MIKGLKVMIKDDLVVGEKYQNVKFSEAMAKEKNKVLTVDFVQDFPNRKIVSLKENPFLWSAEMLSLALIKKNQNVMCSWTLSELITISIMAQAYLDNKLYEKHNSKQELAAKVGLKVTDYIQRVFSISKGG